jgi:regulator of protease activity HflC (stomatin/prohibitin superfamily)
LLRHSSESDPERIDAAFNRVLAAEAEARARVARCREEAERILASAEERAHRISSRADERILIVQQRADLALKQALAEIPSIPSEHPGAITDPATLSRLARAIEELADEMIGRVRGVSDAHRTETPR